MEGQSKDYIFEYMQEINDLIVKDLYLKIFGNNYNSEMSRQEQEFQTKYDRLAETITP